MFRRLSVIAAAVLTSVLASGAGAQPGGLGRGIAEIARANGLEPALVAAIISVESDFNARAVSRRGARGMMQLMPATARELGVGNIDDPWENIEGGARYFREKLARFGGDLRLALAAYNAGEGAVRQFGGVPPYPETIGFVSEVIARYHALRARELPSLAESEPPARLPEPPVREAVGKPAVPPPAAHGKPAIVVEVEEVGPSAKAVGHLREGARLAREGRSEAAMEQYRRAQVLAPASPEPRNQLGLLYLRAGRLEDAQTEFEAAVRAAPGTPMFLNNLGLVLYMRGEFRSALAMLRRAWEGDRTRVESGVNVALVLRHLGRRDEAREVLTRVLLTRDRLPEGHLNLASLAEEDGDRATALRHYRRYLELTDGEGASLADEVRARMTALTTP